MSVDFEPLAIIGIGCNLPGRSTNATAFWRMLSDGVCGISTVPEDRWSKGRFFDSNKAALGKASTNWGAFIEGIKDFDAEFFGISPREAEAMDPQQRLLLMTTWRAFEDAGVSIETLQGSNTSVFVGISGADYTQIQRFRRTGENMHAGPGGAMSIAANRISHKFDFRGPSISVDTACSSSLVATTLACESIWHRHSDIAIAAGINALLEPGVFVNFSKANMMSPTGRIKTFDASADGYVRGEGAGVLIIKRCSQAIKDQDRIYAVIRSAYINQDGHTSTITIPSAEAQTTMLLEATSRAGLVPDDIDFVEAHGTGTPVGDPIEAHAIGRAFGVSRNRRRPVLLGAGKTNTGHLESAAGVTGVIKTALSLFNRQIPRNINFKTPNPEIPFEDLGLALPLKHQSWVSDTGRKRRGAVNSFGFGGTNACAILEEAPPSESGGIRKTDSPKIWFLPLGAQSESGLKTAARELADVVEKAPAERGQDILSNLAMRRAHMTFRAGVIADSAGTAVSALKSFVRGKQFKSATSQVVSGRVVDDPRLVMAFAGQGGAWWGMGHELMRYDRVFADAIAEVDAYFKPLSGWSIVDEIKKPESKYQSSTVYSLPCLFALQVGLHARWRAWGIQPSMIIGHSSGEMAAAYAAGILNLTDTVKIVFHRARLQGTQEGRGLIAAIALGRSEVERVLQRAGITRVDFAGVNGPEMVNLAGDPDAVELAIEELKKEHGADLFARILKLEFAPHSHHMDAVRVDFLESIKDIQPLIGSTPMISTVTGNMLLGPMADAAYWWRNVRDTVLFDNGMREVLRLGGNAFLEIGPHLNLSALISPILAETGGSSPVVTSLKRGEPSGYSLMNAMATLFTAGVSPVWNKLYEPSPPYQDLPPYQFELKPFWLDSEESQSALFGAKGHPLLGARTYSPQAVWINEISLDEHKYLNDHLIEGSVIFPAAGYLEIMFAVARELLGEGAIELENVEVLEAMILSTERTEMVQTSFETSRNRISIYSRQRGSNLDWTLRARGIARTIPTLSPPRGKPLKVVAGGIKCSDMYKQISKRGYTYGRSFREAKTLWRGAQTATLEVSKSSANTEGYFFHPGRLDSSLHVGFGLQRIDTAAANGMYLPVRIERAVLYQDASNGRLWSQASTVSFDRTSSVMDIDISKPDGSAVLSIQGFTTRAISIGGPKIARDVSKPAFVLEEWIEADIKKATRKNPGKGQTWLVFVDRSPQSLSEKALTSLSASGARVIRVTSLKSTKDKGAQTLAIDAANPIAFDELLSNLIASGEMSKNGPAGVLFAWPADRTARTGNLDRLRHSELELNGTIGLLHTVQALAKKGFKPRLWVMTRGAMVPEALSVGSANLETAMLNAAVAGMTRTILTEHADLKCSLIDVDQDTKNAAKQLSDIASILTGGTEETEISMRAAKYFVPRIKMEEQADLAPLMVPIDQGSETLNYRLGMTRPGDIDQLFFQEVESRRPGPGEVRISIKAGGLNFRDVMAATGLLPADAESGVPTDSLGLEASGVVDAIGAGVKRLKVGDRVMTTAKGCFQSSISVAAIHAHVLPKQLNFIDAATIPSAFATAYFALVRLARLRKGETVLVHLGTGGVGLAAIQIAKLLGAKVISTAGSDVKRDYLRKIGVDHVFDSRALDFAEGVRRVTVNRGVDVVLNALAGDAIPLGISILAAGGRFVEIGKRDIYGDSALGLRALRRNVAFFALDMARMDQDDPQSLAEVYQDVLDHFAQGRLKPLPALVFKASNARDAFKAMAQAKHIGKVVIDFSDPDLRVGVSNSLPLSFAPKGAYIVTGGLGGFGAEVVRFLAERGAKHFYLVGRSGATRPEAKVLLSDLKKSGAIVKVIAADIANYASVEDLVKQIARDNLSLKGVFHSAMVLDDGFVAQLNASRMLNVLEPKILGAWNLHRATQGVPLDYFVMFSSMAATIGSSGQANYVAANRYLDLLAAHRQTVGLPALTINWGALGGAGAVQRNKAILKYLKTLGMPPLSLEEALVGLETAMRSATPAIGYCKIDWQAVARANSGLNQIPRFGDVANAGPQAAGGGRTRSELLAAKGLERERLLKDYIGKQISRVLKIDAKSLQTTRPLNELGLDSLTSFQLKNKIESDIGINLPVGRFLQKPTIESLSVVIGQVLEASATSSKKSSISSSNKLAGNVLSPRQEWLWHRIKADGTFPTHGMMELIYALEVQFPIDIDRLNQAFLGVVKRHQVLRSVFPSIKGEPSIVMSPLERFKVQYVDAIITNDEDFLSNLNVLANTPHDLEVGPLIDLRVFARPGGRNVIVLRSHVILTDGWSFGALLRDVFQGYFGLGGTDAVAGEATEGFLAFARKQRDWLKIEQAGEARAYWKEKLKSLPPPIQVGQYSPKTIDPLAGGYFIKRYVHPSAMVDPRAAARALGVSMHAMMAAAFHVQLYKTSRAQDIVLVTNVANRTSHADERLVGWLANHALVRCKLDPAQTFRQHAQSVAHAFQESVEHSSYPVHLVLEAAAESNKGTILPHFVGFNMMWPDNAERNGFEALLFAPPGTPHKFGGLEITMLPVAAKSVGHFLNDIAITYQEVDGQLFVSLHCRDGVFEAGQDELFLDNYLATLANCIAKPAMTVSELSEKSEN